MAVVHCEAPRESRVHWDVIGVVEADRALRVVRACGQEPVVALGAPGIPVVGRRRPRADAVGVRLVGACGDRLGGDQLPRRIAVVEVLAGRHREAGTPPTSARVEVRRICAEPTQVVVEGAVLHHQHHHGVDGARRRGRRKERLACRCRPGELAAEQCGPVDRGGGGERAEAPEFPPRHPARHVVSMPGRGSGWRACCRLSPRRLPPLRRPKLSFERTRAIRGASEPAVSRG